MDDPKLKQEKKDSANILALGLPIGLPMGIAVGLSLGVALESLPVGVAIGVGIGMSFSVAIGAGRLNGQKKSDKDPSELSDGGVE